MDAVLRVVVRRRVAETDRRGRTAGGMRAQAITEYLGPEPDAFGRRDLLRLAPGLLVLVGFAFGVLGIVAGAGVGALGALTAAHWVTRVFGAILTAPCLALGVVWAIRAQVNEIGMRRWERQTDGGSFQPSVLSQPKDRDFLYALPIAVALAVWFLAA
jgi:hypothetical protein